MKARDDAYEEGCMAAGRKGRAGCRPSEFELLPTPLPTQPTTAKRRCAALHTEPLVDEFFTLLKSAETTAEPRTLPDFRPRAAAWKRQNTLPEPSEHPKLCPNRNLKALLCAASLGFTCTTTTSHVVPTIIASSDLSKHFLMSLLISSFPLSSPGLSPSRARAEPEPATRARLAMY